MELVTCISSESMRILKGKFVGKSAPCPVESWSEVAVVLEIESPKLAVAISIIPLI